MKILTDSNINLARRFLSAVVSENPTPGSAVDRATVAQKMGNYSGPSASRAKKLATQAVAEGIIDGEEAVFVCTSRGPGGGYWIPQDEAQIEMVACRDLLELRGRAEHELNKLQAHGAIYGFNADLRRRVRNWEAEVANLEDALRMDHSVFVGVTRDQAVADGDIPADYANPYGIPAGI